MTHYEEPVHARPAGVSGGDVGASESDVSSAAATPFDGLLAFADVLSENDPVLADVFVGGAQLAQAVLEEQLPTLLGDVGKLLGMSRSGIDNLTAALGANTLPFTPEALASDLADAAAEVTKIDPALLAGDDNGRRFIGAAIQGFVDSPQTPDDSRSQYDRAIDWIQEHATPGAFHWRASCALERPSVLGGITPIRCAATAHRWRGGDRISAMEWTYGRRIFPGFEGTVRTPGPVGAIGPGGGYQKFIDDDHPGYYWDTIDAGTGGWVFALYFTEGARIRLPWKLCATLDAKQPQIDNLIGQQIDRDRGRIQDLLVGVGEAAGLSAGVALSAAHPVIPLMAAAAKALVRPVLAQFVKLNSDVNLTTWTIWHTTLLETRRGVPVSIFTIARSDQETPGLCRLKTDAAGQPIADDDYQYDPNIRRQARFMIGHTTLGSPNFDPRYFDLVADKGQPLAWREPLETNSGLRILVPHQAGGSKASYVSALRADVLPAYVWEI
jgi:hypothetical protein